MLIAALRLKSNWQGSSSINLCAISRLGRAENASYYHTECGEPRTRTTVSPDGFYICRQPECGFTAMMSPRQQKLDNESRIPFRVMYNEAVCDSLLRDI